MGSKKINLALQGGGSHGAFTWGVIDALLDDERISFDGICGTSAGAMNAVVTAYGLQQGGREGAKALLRRFWRRVSITQCFSPIQPTWWDRMTGNYNQSFSFSTALRELWTLYLSPYQFNPLDYNPLRSLLDELIDFEELKHSETKLFVCATDVKAGRVKVFSCADMTRDAVLASACLPYLFQAVEIEGRHYWDGGFMGNPPIFPLIDDTETPDILLVQINPINIDEIPNTAEEIRNRINELSFNSALMKEMRSIRSIDRMLEAGYTDNRFRKLFIHHINLEESTCNLGVSSKLNADWKFLLKLHDIGHRLATKWLNQHFDDIGQRTSVNLEEVFL